jgi:hypothetical protein
MNAEVLMKTTPVGILDVSRARQLAVVGFAAAALTLATSAAASFRIESLYSDQSGAFQYIELRENSADGRVTPLAGSIITVTRGDVVKRYVIPNDPPAAFPAGGSLLVSTVADWSSDDFGFALPRPPDYVMRVRFLPTDGGTIDLDGQAPWTFDALPTDGSTALLRSGETASASVRSFALGNISMHIDFVNLTEYYNDALGRFFMSGAAPDLDAIESDRIKGWAPTGYWLPAFAVPLPVHCCSTYGHVAVPVCRFYIPPEAGDSHFFSAFVEECDEVATKFPSFVLETREAFYVYLPDKETGACPVPFHPVYRLWNQRADTNHRYIYDNLPLRIPMLQEGWIPEGRGPAGVAWCI